LPVKTAGITALLVTLAMATPLHATQGTIRGDIVLNFATTGQHHP
jgi:hypothetical protein